MPISLEKWKRKVGSRLERSQRERERAMRVMPGLIVVALAGSIFAGGVEARMPFPQPQEEAKPQVQTAPQQEHAHHHHGEIRPVQAEYPRLGRAQERAQCAL